MDKEELAKLVDARRDTFYYTRVLPEYKGFWMSVSKVASITTAIALSKLEGLEPFEWGDEGISELQHYTTPEIVEILTSPDGFRFCFIRNPYDRLFSAYKSKIGNVMAPHIKT